MATATRKPAARKPAPKKPSTPSTSDTPVQAAARVPDPQSVPPGYPILTGGSADHSVIELTTVLTAAGYPCPIGTHVTPDVIGAVRAFRQARDVPEEEGVVNPENHIGPNTWAAILAE